MDTATTMRVCMEGWMAGWMDGRIKSCTECMALQFCVGHAHALSHVTAADVAVHRRLKCGHASLLTADAIRRGAYPTAQNIFSATGTLMVQL